jgi:hypothetical protein
LLLFDLSLFFILDFFEFSSKAILILIDLCFFIFCQISKPDFPEEIEHVEPLINFGESSNFSDDEFIVVHVCLKIFEASFFYPIEETSDDIYESFSDA